MPPALPAAVAAARAAAALAIRQTRGQASLLPNAGGLARLSPEAMAVRLELQAPGRTLAWLRLDSARGRLDTERVLTLVEPGRQPLPADSPLLTQPWQEAPQSFLLYSTDPGSSRVSAVPYVVTAGFTQGPLLRVTVRL